jgi:putative transposase
MTGRRDTAGPTSTMRGYPATTGSWTGSGTGSSDSPRSIRLAGMTHVRTSPYYPQSNGKIERFHLSLKSESIRMHSLSTREQAERVITAYIRYYNEERLNSAIGYIAPADRLAGRHEAIHAERDRRLEEARARRAQEKRVA